MFCFKQCIAVRLANVNTSSFNDAGWSSRNRSQGFYLCLFLLLKHDRIYICIYNINRYIHIHACNIYTYIIYTCIHYIYTQIQKHTVVIIIGNK